MDQGRAPCLAVRISCDTMYKVTNKIIMYGTGNLPNGGVLNEKEFQMGGNICIVMADLLCCIADTNTTL